MARLTRSPKLTKLAMVNICISPPPRRTPSTDIFMPMKQKKKHMNKLLYAVVMATELFLLIYYT